MLTKVKNCCACNSFSAYSLVTNTSISGNGNNIPYHLKRTYESLTRRQREIYNDFISRDAKILYLEGLIEKRKKSVCLSRILIYVVKDVNTSLIILVFSSIFLFHRTS